MKRVERFFQELYGDCLGNGRYIELRSINQHEDKRQQFFFSSVDEFLPTALEQKPGYDHFYGVNPRQGKKGTSEAVKLITCVWADVDFKNFKGGKTEAIDALRKFFFGPTVVVNSGHGFQAYWLFKEPESVDSIEKFRAILRGVQHVVSSDMVDDLVRILRVPDTKNYKFLKEVVPCTIIFAHYSRRYNLSDFEVFVSNGEKLKPTQPIEQKIPKGKRNNSLASLAGALRRKGGSRGAILAALKVENRRCTPPLPEVEVERIAGNISRYSPTDRGGPSLLPVSEALEQAGFGELVEGSDIDSVETVVLNLARLANGFDGIRKVSLRESAIRKLRELGVVSAPAKFLDAAFGSSTGNGDETENSPGQTILLSEPEPWLDEVNGLALIEEMATFMRRFVVLPTGALEAICLWILHTFALLATIISPILALVSPEKRCAKTLLLELIFHLVVKPLSTANITTAALFRTVEKYKPTLLVDEADTFLKRSDELRGVINSGHRRTSAVVIRTVGDSHEPKLFKTWCPKVIALIGDLPGTIQDRSIVIRMRRKTADEQVERLRLEKVEQELETIRCKAARWTADYLDGLRDADPILPGGLDDRAQDNWRPLIAIADCIGGDWPERSRAAAVRLSGATENEDASARIQLLGDLQQLFVAKDADCLSSEEIVNELLKMEDRPWPEWKKGKPITKVQLARLLKPFGVNPTTIRVDSTRRPTKGYKTGFFDDVFSRYLSPDPSHPLQSSYNPVLTVSYGVTAGFFLNRTNSLNRYTVTP